MSKILFVDQYAQLGGGQRILLDLVRHLREAHEVAVALPGGGPVADILENEGVTGFTYDLTPLTAGKKPVVQQLIYFAHARTAAKGIGDAARALGADLIYCNGPRCAMPTVLAARDLRLPVICGAHLIFGGNQRRLLRWCFKKPEVRRVTFCSSVAADAFPELAGNKGLVLWNWVSPPFLCEPIPARARQDVIRVGVLGRISRNKGQLLFVDALLPLLSEYPNLELVIGGGTDFEDALEEPKLVERAQGHPRIKFEGSISDAVGFIDSLDVLVVPSVWEEPFGLVAVEGMARMLPIVATKSGGLKDIVVDGETGFLVEKEASSLREAVKRLIDDASLRARFGEAGRTRVLERFNPKQQLSIVSEIVDEALSHSIS